MYCTDDKFINNRRPCSPWSLYSDCCLFFESNFSLPLVCSMKSFIFSWWSFASFAVATAWWYYLCMHSRPNGCQSGALKAWHISFDNYNFATWSSLLEEIMRVTLTFRNFVLKPHLLTFLLLLLYVFLFFCILATTSDTADTVGRVL